ncbi:MAG: DUF6101 family protein [Labrys sp. (in: a-proteobacteria)]|jgi:hypothetical protein
MRRHPASDHHAAATARAVSARAASPPLILEMADTRADSGTRRIQILSEGVVVERSVAGVSMRLALALDSYQGVAVSAEGDGPTLRVRVTLLHRDRDLDVTLFEASDDRDVTAEWVYWSNRFALPMLMIDRDGRLIQPYGQLGALTVGKTAPRRKGSILSGRRPRFLVRRRPGTPAETPVVHREREIIARD